MSVLQLASISDVSNVLGRDLTASEEARVDAILDKASELFRRRSGQTFTLDRSEVRLKVTAGRIYLPQRPVTTVHSVRDDDGNTIGWTLFKQWLTLSIQPSAFAIVDYSHGGEVPDIVRLTIAEVAKKVLTIDPAAVSGVTQRGETTGPFTEQFTYATWAQGGQTMLAPDDIALADSLRVRTPGTIVQAAPASSTRGWLQR